MGNHSRLKRCIPAVLVAGMLTSCGFVNPRDRQRPGYVLTDCPKGGLQIIYFGQSNSTNSVSPRSPLQPPPNLYQYDWRNGTCYLYREPLLGADGIGGNTISPAAINLARQNKEPVTIIPFGVSRSSVLNWAFGPLALQQERALRQARRSGLAANVFLWHQGETDAKLHQLALNILKTLPISEHHHGQLADLSRSLYRHALQTVIDRARGHFPGSHFGIALASRCSGTLSSQPIRAAQRDAARQNSKAFISADSDRIDGPAWRPDGCHFSSAGAQVLSHHYEKAIKAALALPDH